MAKNTRAERLQRRLETVEAVTARRAEGFDKALASMGKLWEHGRQPTQILIRIPFMETSNGEPPPVSKLINGRGHALRVALMALMAAQCRKGPAPHVLELPLTSHGHTAVGWENLIVSDSVPGDRSYSRPVDQKHAASARKALRRLADDEISLVQLPHPLPRKGGYDHLHLFQDRGPRELGHPVAYTVPDANDANDPVIAIPINFFLKGWIYVLEDAEVATYLMYRRLCPHFHPEPAHISATQRKALYGITQPAWEMYWVLEDAGLIAVEPDPHRREDGTVDGQSDGTTPKRHKFTLNDSGLETDALQVMWKVIDERTDKG